MCCINNENRAKLELLLDKVFPGHCGRQSGKLFGVEGLSPFDEV